ncbi:MAG: MliC family protein [Casimicrobiaceae bacterium]
MMPALVSRCALSVACLAVALALSACKTGPTQEELQAARETIDCHHGDEHIVIRFDEAEARMLMQDGKRVILYQVPAGSGVRYMNGDMELRGKGLDMTLLRFQGAMHLDCKPFEIPKT